MRSRHHDHHPCRRRPFHALPILARGLRRTWHVDSGRTCFRAPCPNFFFLTLSGIRGPDSTFRLLRKDIYWLHLVRKSRGYLDWDLGVRASRAQNSKGAVAERKARRGERERRATISPTASLRFQRCSEFETLRISRTFFLPSPWNYFFFDFVSVFVLENVFFWGFFQSHFDAGNGRWWGLKVFCRLFFFLFWVVGLFLNEKRRFLAFRVWKKRGEKSFRFLFSMTLVSIDCLILFTDSFGIWTGKVFCKCFCW